MRSSSAIGGESRLADLGPVSFSPPSPPCKVIVVGKIGGGSCVGYVDCLESFVATIRVGYKSRRINHIGSQAGFVEAPILALPLSVAVPLLTGRTALLLLWCSVHPRESRASLNLANIIISPPPLQVLISLQPSARKSRSC